MTTSPTSSATDDITVEQAMQNAIDEYAKQMARRAFGYFFTFGGREAHILPTEDIMKSVEAVFSSLPCSPQTGPQN